MLMKSTQPQVKQRQVGLANKIVCYLSISTVLTPYLRGTKKAP